MAGGRMLQHGAVSTPARGGVETVEDTFDNPLQQNQLPTSGVAAASFELEVAHKPRGGTEARGTKMLRVTPQSQQKTNGKTAKKSVHTQQKKDEELRQHEQKNGLGRMTRLGGGMKRLMRFPESFTYHGHHEIREDPRKPYAEQMWKRIFAMLDFKNDHALTINELCEGLQMIRSRWEDLQELYPCGEAAFAEHLIRRAGSQDDSEQDIETIRAEVDGLNHNELLAFASQCGVSERLCTISDHEIARKIVVQEGRREALRAELEMLPDSLLEMRDTTIGNHTSHANHRNPNAAWEILTAGTIYVSGIDGRLEGEEELKRLLNETFGEVLAVKVRVRQQPQKSWALCTFAEPSSCDVALNSSNWLSTSVELIAKYGIAFDRVDHRKAQASTGAFGDVWRQTRAAISDVQEQQMRKQAWRKAVIDAAVDSEPELEVIKDMQGEVDVAVCKALVQHLHSANVTDDMISGAKRDELLELALQHPSSRSKLTDESGLQQRAMRKKLRFHSLSDLVDQARKLNGSSMDQLNERATEGLVYEDVLQLVWQELLKLDLIASVHRIEVDVRHSALLRVARACGLRDSELMVSVEQIRSLILASRLDSLATPDAVTDVLLPCSVAVAATLGDKIPNNIDFCSTLRELLDDNPDAVKAYVEGADGVMKGNDVHPTFDAMLTILTDPHLTHFVVPQLEAWLQLHTILDLSRSGDVPFCDLQGGIETACAPEIDIIQTSVMVADLLTSTKFIIRQRQLLQHVASIVVDDPTAILAEDRLCVLSQLTNRLPEATYHCQRILHTEFTKFQFAADRVGHAVRCRFNLPSLDSSLYELWKAAHTLVNAISCETRGDSLVMRKNPELRKQVIAFKSVIQQDIMHRCSSAMNSHVAIYSMRDRGQHVAEQTRIVAKYVASYLLRRRIKLLSSISRWARDSCKLEKLQGRMRGILERRRLNKAYQNSVGLTNGVPGDNRVDVDVDDQMQYFDWTQVLVDYLRDTPMEVRAKAVIAVLHTNKELQEAILKAEEDGEDLPDLSNDGGAGVEFPQTLLYPATMQSKLNLLQQTRNRWHELLLMLDKDGSGTLLPLDLRCSLMAFSEMGIITEMEEQQPMDENLKAKAEQLEFYAKEARTACTTGDRVGWDPSVPKFSKRQGYKSKVSVGEELKDYPIYFSENQVVLTGIYGVDLAGSAWALTVDFQFDVDDPDDFVGASKYSVLTTSYRNNAILARLSGTIRTPGIQLIFVPRDAFRNAATAVEKCAEYEQAGRDTIYEEFPSGRGKFECTPFIPMRQLQWYRLELQGGPASDVSSKAGTDHQMTRLCIRVDPIDHDTREIIAQPETAPNYDSDGKYVPSEAMKQVWFDGRPSLQVVNRPRPKQRRNKNKDPLSAQVKPWMATEWLGEVDFRDIYAIGNVFDNNCCDASSVLNWSIGPLSNVRVFAVQRTWLKNCVYQWPDSVGQSTGDNIGTVSAPASDKYGDFSPNAKETQQDVGDLPDLRFFLLQATESADHAIFLGARSRGQVRKWAVRGIYQLVADLQETPREEITFDASLYNPFNPEAWYYVDPSLKCVCDFMLLRYLFLLARQSLATGYNLPLCAEMRNAWQKDFEPGFPFSNSVVNRNDMLFIEKKSAKTTELSRHLLRSIPSKEQRSHWNQPADLKLDSSKMSLARAELLRENPGLNTLLTGPQLRQTMKVMVRSKRLNKKKCKSVVRFWVWPVFYIPRLVCHKATRTSIYELGPAENVLLYVRRETGKSPAVRILGGILLMWLLLAYVLVAVFIYEQSVLHELEPLIAALYYVWAGCLVAIEVADEVLRLPSDTPFKLAYMKSEISTMPITLTRIGNGQELQTTIMGFVQMVCRLHKSDEDDEEEEEEEEEEEADPFKISRKQLQVFWEQGDLQETLPFAEPGVLPSKVIFDYELESHREIESPIDWEDRNDVYMNSMKTRIDTGRPTPRSMKIITLCALMNSLIGVVHRLVFLDDDTEVIGPLQSGDRGGLIVLANMIVTFVSSFVVYRSLFSLTFTWYMTLLFAEQMMKVLLIDSAMQSHLPCYCDLRHEGNLEGWFTGRRYFQTYCMTHVFGVKNQVKIASSLLVAGGFSLQAITEYFADADNIDWTNPGGWFCLLNMFILLALLFLALVALERTNKATIKLVKKLDSVSIEVSRGVDLEVEARLERDEERIMNAEEKRARARERQAKIEKQDAMFSGGVVNQSDVVNQTTKEVNDLKQRVCELEETLRETLVNTNDLVNRHDISQEARYLQVVISQLANQPLLKIFGIVVDREMLSKVFGGVVFMLYSVLKSSIDAILIKYMPPSPMKMALERANEASGGALGDIMANPNDGSGSWSMLDLLDDP